MTSSVVKIRDLRVEYRRDGRVTQAVRGIDLDIDRGERVAIVGESGSGKSTVALALLGLLPSSGHIVEGSARVADVELAGASERTARRIRGRVVGLVPQDPTVSLNPTQRVGHQVGEAVRLRGVPRPLVDAAVVEALTQAGIDDPVTRARQYPHQLSGGLRQRVLIAIALAGDPDVLVADEPTSALDVTVQKQILKLISELQARHGTALLFVTHDLGVVSKVCDTLSVLYAGKVVEDTTVERFFAAPQHAYSSALLAATPRHTDPASSLQPVPRAVLDAVAAEIVASDSAWRPNGGARG